MTNWPSFNRLIQDCGFIKHNYIQVWVFIQTAQHHFHRGRISLKSNKIFTLTTPVTLAIDKCTRSKWPSPIQIKKTFVHMVTIMKRQLSAYNTLNSYRPVYSHCSLPVAPLKLVHLYINELNLSQGKTAQRVTIPFCSLHTRLISRHFPPQIPRPLRSSRPLVRLETGDSVV